MVRLNSSLVMMLLIAFPAVAFGDYYSQATVVGAAADFPDQTVGGWGESIVSVSGYLVEPHGDYSEGYSGYALASAVDGRAATTSVGIIDVSAAAPAARLSGAGGTRDRVHDYFDIGAGTSGLADGTPVQVVVQARLDGRVQLGGRPSGSGYYSYSVRLGTAHPVDFVLPGMSPPLAFETHEFWDVVVDTTIGARLFFDILTLNQVNGTAWDPGEAGHNVIVFDSEAHVVHAPGFGDIEIISDGGASTNPLIRADDADNDGVLNTADNCVVTANADQRDTDADGHGNVCDADFDNSCLVNFIDLNVMKSRFFSADPDADLNGDGIVNFADLNLMKQMFFGRPGPSATTQVCNPGVFASGDFIVDTGFAIDLDLGVQSAPSDVTADMVWHPITDFDSSLAPVNGARQARFGASQPSYADCVAAPISSADTSLWVTATDVWHCAETGDGRLARFKILSADIEPLAAASQMQIRYVTWE